MIALDTNVLYDHAFTLGVAAFRNGRGLDRWQLCVDRKRSGYTALQQRGGS
jgi:hypothetical protein